MAYDEPAQALSVVDFMFLKVVTNLVYLGGEEKVAKNVRLQEVLSCYRN
jgi:hypothetical protein